MKTHRMTLCVQYATGIQDWQCPICGRRFLARLAPCDCKKVIVAEGDADAVHTWGCGVDSRTLAAPRYDDGAAWLAHAEEHTR